MFILKTQKWRRGKKKKDASEEERSTETSPANTGHS